MSARRAGPSSVFGLTALVLAGAWVCWFLGGLGFRDAVGSYLLTNTVVSGTFTAFGAVVLAHRPRHRIGRLFVGFGACYTASVACLGVLSGPFPLSPGWERAVDLVGITVWTPAPAVGLPLILQLFPDGRVLTPRWRVLVAVTVGLLVLTPALTLAPGAISGEPIADTSPVLPPALGGVVGSLVPVVLATYAVVLAASLLVLVLRSLRARGAERLQTLWLLWAVVVFVVLNAQRVVTGTGPVLFLLPLPLVPAAVAVAIVRHQLYDIRLIINRSVVYGLLTVGVVAVYLGIVAALTPLARDRLSATPVVATAVIALAFAPARAALQAGVDRVMYGRRRHPTDAAARVGTHLGDELEDVLRALCEALRLPSAAIRSGERRVAGVGKVPSSHHVVPLVVRDGPPAALVVGLRAGETTLSRADRRALDLLAAPVGLALQSVRLAEQLRDSRSQIVTAREEERRRLRRDLHDGLGTALTAVTLKADAASNLRQVDPDRSAQLVLELRTDVAAAIADIRRLVHALRPPDLDELGLVPALRQRAQQSWRRADADFSVTVDAPEDLPPLPAAVEVAAYRIASEAVTNALRHSTALRCRISLRADQSLHLDITDDGAGRATPWSRGVGLRSMGERASELGGVVTAGPTAQGGRVQVLLPLGRS